MYVGILIATCLVGAAQGKVCIERGIFDDSTTVIPCAGKCCGTDIFRYCCQDVEVVAALSTTWIIIIVVICVVVVATIVGIIVCCVCCCRQAASSTRTPGMIVINGQGQPNAGYNPGYAGTYPMNTQPQGYSADLSKSQYPVVQSTPPVDTKDQMV